MNNRPKIKLFIFTPTLHCGGSEKFVSMLCNNINTERFWVYLVVLNNNRPFYTITNQSITVIDLHTDRVRFSFFKIKKLIRTHQPDMIFTTSNHLNLYFAIFRNRFSKAVKFIARESSIVSINTLRTSLPWLYNRLIKKYYGRFDRIICQSIYMQQDLISHYRIPENKTAVIHNATAGVLKYDLSAEDYPDKKYRFITVARLCEEKGMERLIHAVGLLSIPFQFFIIGDGNKKAYLQNLVKQLQLGDKVFIKGELAEPFLGMEDADLFLMGSYYEGFPNVLLEAGAHGIPVIAFRVPGGIPEIIKDRENGLLVDDNDILGFAAAIQKGLALNFDRNSIIETTQKRFSVNTISKAIEDLFVKLT